MNKKLITIIVAGVVALAIIITAAVVIIKNLDINAPKTVNLSVGTAEIQKGDTVDIPITVSENPGIFVAQLIVEYDTRALEYISYENGTILDECSVNNADGKIISIINAKELANTTENGTVITLRFKAKQDAAAGDYKVTVSQQSEIANIDEQLISPNITDGKITVK